MRQLAAVLVIAVGIFGAATRTGASTAPKKPPAPKVDTALRNACFSVIVLHFFPDQEAQLFDTQTIARMTRDFEGSKVKGANKLGKRFESVTGPTVAYDLVLTDASAFCVKHGIDTRPYVPPTT